MRAGITSLASGAAGWATGFGLGWPAVIIAAVAFTLAVAPLMWILSDDKRSLRLTQLVCAIRTGRLNSNASSQFGIDQPELPVVKELPPVVRDTERTASSNTPRVPHPNAARPGNDGRKRPKRAAQIPPASVAPDQTTS